MTVKKHSTADFKFPSPKDDLKAARNMLAQETEAKAAGSQTMQEVQEAQNEVKETEMEAVMETAQPKQTEQAINTPTIVDDTTSNSAPQNGRLLVAGRRSARHLDSINIHLDNDVKELIDAVIHPSSNKQMAMNELLRMSLKEIYAKTGHIEIK